MLLMELLENFSYFQQWCGQKINFLVAGKLLKMWGGAGGGTFLFTLPAQQLKYPAPLGIQARTFFAYLFCIGPE